MLSWGTAYAVSAARPAVERELCWVGQSVSVCLSLCLSDACTVCRRLPSCVTSCVCQPPAIVSSVLHSQPKPTLTWQASRDNHTVPTADCRLPRTHILPSSQPLHAPSNHCHRPACLCILSSASRRAYCLSLWSASACCCAVLCCALCAERAPRSPISQRAASSRSSSFAE